MVVLGGGGLAVVVSMSSFVRCADLSLPAHRTRTVSVVDRVTVHVVVRSTLGKVVVPKQR